CGVAYLTGMTVALGLTLNRHACNVVGVRGTGPRDRKDQDHEPSRQEQADPQDSQAGPGLEVGREGRGPDRERAGLPARPGVPGRARRGSPEGSDPERGPDRKSVVKGTSVDTSG